MGNTERSLDPELENWLRYYRDLGFTHLFRRNAEPQRPAPIGIEGPPPDLSNDSSTTMPPKRTGTSKPAPRVEPLSASAVAELVAPPTAASTLQNGLFIPTRPQETLDQIREDLGDCRRCKLTAGRKTIVFGSGNPKAELLFVGEGPGADEDEQGLPFVGRAGQLLTDMIEKGLKIPRPEVYICNIVKCRPPGNRKPERDEVAACRQFMERQIDSVRPRIICAMGSTAAETLLDSKESMGRLRGKWYEFRGFPVMVTYHPAFLLRDPSRKADTWADLKMILARLNAASSA